MGDAGIETLPDGLSNNGTLMKPWDGPAEKKKPKWRFDTLQIHAGLEDHPRYGQCTLPIYNTASFKFASSAALNVALGDIASSQNHLYTRVSNVSFRRKTIV